MSRPRFALLALLYAAFMLYGSTVVSPTGFSPKGLSFDQAVEIFRHVQFIQTDSGQRADWMANLIAMIPLGFMVAGAMQRRFAGVPERITVAFAALLLCEAHVLGVKFAQVFFPRTVTLNYITAQSIGAVCGVLLCVLFRDGIEAMLRRLSAPGPAALSVLLGLYSLALAIFTLVPFDVVLSAGDLALRLSTLGQHLFEIPGEGRSVPIRAVLVAMAVLAAVPVGMWLGLRWRAGAAMALGLLAVTAVTVASMFVLSASPNLLNFPLRVIGIAIGVALVGALRRHDIERVRPALATLALWGILPYLALLAVVNGLATPQWRSLEAAMAAVDQRFYIPLWTHYIVTKAQAARSVASQIAMYAPIGVIIWLRGGRGASGAWLAGVLAFIVSAGVELGRWLKPGLLLDINDPAIAGFAAAMTVLVMPVLWRALRSVGRELPPEPPAIPRPREPGGGALGALVLLVAVALDGWGLWTYPLPVWPLAAALFAYILLLWRWPQAWLVVIPAILPALDLTPWTGWMLVGESDFFVLATLGVLAVRTRPAWPRLGGALAAVVLLFLASALISLGRGLALPGPPGGTSDIYMMPENALRLAKPLLIAVLLLPFAAQRWQRHGDALRLFAWGMVLGLCLVAGMAGLERMAFVSLFDFATDYRAAGPFSSMHVGGGHIGAYLALAIPFILVLTIRARWWSPLLLAVVVPLASYGLVVTFARTAYAAGLVGVVMTCLVLLAGSRERGPVQALGAAVIMLGIGGAVLTAATQSGFMQARLAALVPDFMVRVANWKQGLQLQSPDPLSRAFGMGSGSYLRLKAQAGDAPSDFQVHAGDGSYLTLREGPAMYFGQKVDVRPGQDYRLTFRLRAVQPGGMAVVLCEKYLVSSLNCAGQGFTPAAGGGWTAQSAILRLAAETAETAPAWLPRPADLAFFAAPGTAFDFTAVHLLDASGHDLIRNGDFAGGTTHWYFTADNHVGFRILDQYLMSLLEGGMAGLLAWCVLLLASALAPWRAVRRGEALAASLTGAVAAVSVSCLSDAVLESARLASVIFFIAGMAVICSREGGVKSGKPLAPRA